MAHYSNSHNVQFEDLVSRPPDLSLVPTIPRISHVVHTKLSEMTWRSYTSACAFVQKIGVEKPDIWVPEGEELPDEMREGIKNLPNVVVRPFHDPKGVWGKKLDHPAHLSDVSRIKILYEEGGAHDLVWMKSHSSTIKDTQYFQPLGWQWRCQTWDEHIRFRKFPEDVWRNGLLLLPLNGILMEVLGYESSTCLLPTQMGRCIVGRRQPAEVRRFGKGDGA
ncbi:MAG: hypothetical protein ALECFALPRED_005746 [Alectoria fallacina]|uniref:Uncharacterized protein n=1 Tax=Alectoria fallacina TaxID=1903189 RepID=A0A8H3IV73_9LECA|nr:MAG: hypothetical protein ALECFALPRED_005746 [Alectoria fallacina]